MYDDLRSFCLFVGPNRTGSSLVGSLLDAHRHALIAHELDLFEERGATGRLRFSDRIEMFDAIAKQSRRAAERGRLGRRRGGSVSYAVANQHQGEADPLRVIGTKRANRTMFALKENPAALKELADQVALELRLVHVVRNPFDAVASMTPKGKEMRLPRYVRISHQISAIRQAGWEVQDVHVEELIRDPRGELARLCGFLGLEVEPGYLDDCAAVVMPQPHESRHGREWRAEEIETIEGLIAEFRWLERYSGSEVH